MNIFKGKLGRAFFYQKPFRDQLQRRYEFEWATSVKPGDLVNCCDYWNRVVERVEHTWATIKKDKEFGLCVGRWVTHSENHPNLMWIETTFYFTDGYSHSTGGGCAVPAWTAEEVRSHVECDDRGCKLS